MSYRNSGGSYQKYSESQEHYLWRELKEAEKTSMTAKSKRWKNINKKSLKFSLRTPHTITNMSNDILGNKTTQAVSHANKHKESNYGLLLVFKQTKNMSGLLTNFTLHPVSSHRSTESLFSTGLARQRDCLTTGKKWCRDFFFPKGKDLSVEVIVKRSLHKGSRHKWFITRLLFKDTNTQDIKCDHWLQNYT